jgi:non-canonical purine NTP pyrophosphatase (RdgB/HAM1 family)
MKMTFITGNAAKAKYAALWLGHPLEHQKLDLDEIQSLQLREVVEYKVRQAYGKVSGAVLVEDTSLEFVAMNGAPGPLIKWFDAAGGTIICHMLDGFETRLAVARTCYGLYDGREIHFFEGVMHGRIADSPAGQGGFGWDNIFINDGHTITRAEMDEETYKATSYRRKALDQLAAFLSPSLDIRS